MTNRSRELLDRTKISLRASDCSLTPLRLQRWKEARLRTWYDGNKDALKRNVSIKRIVILKRSDVIRNGRWDQSTLDILTEQQTDGVDIRIIWYEDVEIQKERHPLKNVLRDFVIYDDKEVLEDTGEEVKMYRPPSIEFEDFREVFKTQEKYATKLTDLLSKKIKQSRGLHKS